MSRRGENIYKRQDGRWEARYIFCYENNRAKYKSVYGKSYKEAKEKQTLARTNCTLKIDKKETENDIYMNQWFDRWLISSKNRVKESTYIRYKNSIDNHLKPSLGKYRLSEISTRVLEEFVSEKLRYGNIISHKSLSPKTVADLLTIVKNVITYAQHEGMVIRCNLDNICIKKSYNEMRILSDFELELLLNTLLKNPDRYKMGILLCMYTGIRIGELCSLKCGDISIEEQVVKINKTMQRLQYSEGNAERKTRIIITEPKSTSGIRTIPLQEHLLKLLAPFLNNPKAYFLSGQISSIVEPRVMQNKFKKYISQSGIDNINFHCLRHTFATKCVEQGFDIKSLSEILGHSSVKTTLDKYVHSSMKLKRDNMNKFTLL